MKAVIQRVSNANVSINDSIYNSIGQGLMVLLGIEDADTIQDIDWMVGKISGLRIFDDDQGVMNLSVQEIRGEVLLISQFTLHASTKKGNRPSYLKAAKPDIAIPLYESFIQEASLKLNKPVKTGVFGANMKVSLLNDGPVTIIIDSKNKE